MAVVLEFGHGGELYHYVVKKRFLTEFQTVKIMKQLVSAIAYLHSKGYVHRDIKPENIVMLDANPDKEKDYRIKLIDFGYSRHMNNRMVSFVGTLNYVAPEILQRVPYDHSVDIWSLGVIVFVLLQGYLPFDLTGQAHLDNYTLYLDPNDFKHVSNEGKDFLKSMLALNPKKRPSAKQLLEHPWLNNNMHRNRRESLQNLASPTKLAGMVASPEKGNKEINKTIDFNIANEQIMPNENKDDDYDTAAIPTSDKKRTIESTYVNTNDNKDKDQHIGGVI
jgi:calcium/calmodulin-dependent protein kinase I